jgi:hypothetical protein
MTKISASLGAIVLLGFAVFPASAANVMDHPLEEKIQHSDLVVVGRVLDRPTVRGDFGDEYIWVRPKFFLKGASKGDIQVETHDPAPEFSIACCSAGSKYLFLLRSVHGNRYAPVSGYHGVYQVPDDQYPDDGK